MASSCLTEDRRHVVVTTPCSWCDVGHVLEVIGDSASYGIGYADWVLRVCAPPPVSRYMNGGTPTVLTETVVVEARRIHAAASEVGGDRVGHDQVVVDPVAGVRRAGHDPPDELPVRPSSTNPCSSMSSACRSKRTARALAVAPAGARTIACVFGSAVGRAGS